MALFAAGAGLPGLYLADRTGPGRADFLGVRQVLDYLGRFKVAQLTGCLDLAGLRLRSLQAALLPAPRAHIHAKASTGVALASRPGGTGGT